MRRMLALSLMLAGGCNKAEAPAAGARPALPAPPPPPVVALPAPAPAPKPETPAPPPPPSSRAIVLLRAAALPSLDAVVQGAASFGAPALTGGAVEGEALRFEAGLVSVRVELVSSAVVDAASAPRGPFSPRAEEVAAHTAHLIVSASGLPGDTQAQDAAFVRLLAGVVESAEGAIAASAGPGVVWHRADAVLSMTKSAAAGEVPYELTVNLSVGAPVDGRLGMRSHGMGRYGREEFYVTATRPQMPDALDLVLGMVRWLATSTHQLPTGETVGRSADEKVEVRREPHPDRPSETVIRLDL